VVGKFINRPGTQNYLKRQRTVTQAMRDKVDGPKLAAAAAAAQRGVIGAAAAQRDEEKKRPRIHEE
jgi:hypothetical protein